MARYGRLMSGAISLLAMGLGVIFSLWSLVCLFGGPDGKLGDPESLMYAALFGIVGFITVLYSWKWFRWSVNRKSPDHKTMPDGASSTPSVPLVRRRTGEKIGWLAGFSGAFLWVFILSLILLIQNKVAQCISGLLLVGLAALSIVFLAPWRHPHTPYWKLMAPIYALFFSAVVWAIWGLGGAGDSGVNCWSVFLVIPMLLPFGIMGKKTWTDFGNGGDG